MALQTACQPSRPLAWLLRAAAWGLGILYLEPELVSELSGIRGNLKINSLLSRS